MTSTDEETDYALLVKNVTQKRTLGQRRVNSKKGAATRHQGALSDEDSLDGVETDPDSHVVADQSDQLDSDSDTADSDSDAQTGREPGLLYADSTPSHDDPFVNHFGRDISDQEHENAMETDTWVKTSASSSVLGSASHTYVDEKHKPTKSQEFHLKKSLEDRLKAVNENSVPSSSHVTSLGLTDLQAELFSYISQYQDVYYPNRTHVTGEELRLLYCLHAANHILKTRGRIISHNARLKSQTAGPNEEYRDQGLTRPKVLIIVPFRESARRIVRLMSSLMMSEDQEFVSNKKRFYKEYGSLGSDAWQKGKKSADFEAMFAGNIDDHFRIGLKVAKRSLKLYTEFYSSDIVIASPLGLKTVSSSNGEKPGDYDFLSSIEVLILDQADVFLMQNWVNIWHVMKNINRQPSESRGADFSRARMWALNGWGKAYRHTLVFSDVPSPEINSLFNKHCFNYSGKIAVSPMAGPGTMSRVTAQLPQVFYKLDKCAYNDVADVRFKFFVEKIFPEYKEPVMSRTMIFIPSYFDYVRVRNFFNKENVPAAYLCEYTEDDNIPAARRLFSKGKVQFVLYTERMHFYRRFKLRSVRHLIFYELPVHPTFYSELIDIVQASNNATCSVIYSQYDAQKMALIVGQDRTSHMLLSKKTRHMFLTGEK